MIVLIDTNILLDVIEERKPHDASAARVWKRVELGALTGYISAISINNVFYIVRKQSGNERAMEAVKLLRKLFRIAPLDEGVLDRAIATAATDFEDSIQAAAAVRVKADYIVARNVKHFASLAPDAVTAGEVLAILEPA